MSDAEANQNMGNKCPQCGTPLPSGVLAGLCPACLIKQGAAGDTAIPPDAAPFQPPGIEEVAGLFPQLEILAFIGKGGMGAVYKARQPALDRIVALKILPPQTAGGAGFVERFNREARALAKLNHPNIVVMHEFGQANGLPFFIMEFVDGLNLRELERAGKLSPRQALQIVPQICEALQFAHDEGIVHRDIKPENILVDKKGRVKIADFGIAKILGREQDVAITETKDAIGTPHYMAPEQLEKPTTVDHRADIFSLGVVFYEMLTGELPLGNFRPPSSGKVEVDVRLDEVVLRALEKDPERRYQHASQVKTAVDTIAGTAGSAPAPNGESLAREILARDYVLDIGSCLRRSWALFRKDFWPLVGVTALILALLAVAASAARVVVTGLPHDGTSSGTSALMLLVYGPLLGGLSLYYLKRIRGESTNIEVAFSGFSNRFLHLFLAGFVTWALTALGFVCLIFPGIYLLVAWWFAIILVADKRLDFWPAMELSRKVVTRHWWKFLGFYLLVLLLFALGLVVFVVGFFVLAPFAMIAATYAYEDIFGAARLTAKQPLAGVGPTGTDVLPPIPPKQPRSDGGGWKRAAPIIGVGVLMLVMAMMIHAVKRHHREVEQARESADQAAEPVSNSAKNPPEASPAAATFTFGPVIERDIQARATGTNQFLNLDTQQLLTPSPEIAGVLATTLRPGDDEGRSWEALDIPDGSPGSQYLAWLRESGADLMYAGDGKIIGFDGVFPMGHGDSSTNWDDWNSLTPEQVRAAVDVVDWSRRATEAQLQGEPAPPAPKSGRAYSSAAQLDSREHGGPIVNLLTRDQSVTWFFKTRQGAMGVLQLAGFTDNPRAAKIRYKLVEQTNSQDTVGSGEAGATARATLAARLEAASAITSGEARDRSLARLAVDAAKAGEVEIVKGSLGQMHDLTKRNRAALESVRLLSKRGLTKQAIQVAQDIGDLTTRDQALSELAQ
jgi:predicted Ser/Thr protein kinase